MERQFDPWHMGFCDFQRQHQRMDATGQRPQALTAPRERAKRESAPRAHLLKHWNAFTIDLTAGSLL